MSNDYNGISYETQSQMLEAIADLYVTAFDTNDRETVKLVLTKMSDRQLAQECVTDFELWSPKPGENVSHMTRELYWLYDLADAFAAVRIVFMQPE